MFSAFSVLFLIIVLLIGPQSVGQNTENACRGDDCELLEAARMGDLPKVQSLLRSGANINARGEGGTTPLFEAIACGNNDVASFLIASGADVNVQDPDGETPVMSAAFYRRSKILQELLARKADPNHASKSGYTPLMTSAKSCSECVEVLLASGAIVDAKSRDGETALTQAAFAGNLDAAKLLVKAGANVRHKTMVGLTPLQVAKARLEHSRKQHIRLDGQHAEVIQFLQSVMQGK